ncbi:hypothetical protein AGR4C_Cc50391 [Agrobacterium tumefaciens str. Kerr 14]|uniref:Uncharacterized protein n=1 Tax=Agrobacterium tumefaciens str. Kerr 14 TaxID=1183424 RepID=A0A1S7Q365_AGRTU|nr:hypothetical protein AGR4C_Cc50391 [Agrobacterium tumefaciens str. Kerr 14]
MVALPVASALIMSYKPKRELDVVFESGDCFNQKQVVAHGVDFREVQGKGLSSFPFLRCSYAPLRRQLNISCKTVISCPDWLGGSQR